MKNKLNKYIYGVLLCILVVGFNSTTLFAYETKQEERQTDVQIQKNTNVQEDIEIVNIQMQDLLLKRMSLIQNDCDHEFNTVKIKPSCNRNGYTIGYCTQCNYTYMYDITELAPHQFHEFDVNVRGKTEHHRICTICEYEEIANDEKQISRYFNGKENKETVWASYKATQEERKIIEEKIKNLGIILEKDKLVDDVPGYIWDFLMDRIGNPYGVAGLMGNLFCESGLKSINLQNAYEESFGMSDLEYTAAVDNNTYTREQFSSDSGGYGLAQWTSSGRKARLYDYAKATNRSIGDLDMQLEFLWKELIENYTSMTALLQSTNSVYEASTEVLTKFERPADQSDSAKANRASYGEGYLYVYK